MVKSPMSRPMPEQEDAMKTLMSLSDRYTHLIGTPEGNAPFALLNLGAGQAEKPDRQEGVPHPTFDVLWHSGWIELELQANDLTKKLYRISTRGRAQIERVQAGGGDGAGI
jgi:hypothetical protein